MHVVFVSACEKRAIKRTRAVLDSYAIRVSSTSWATPITLEGLESVRKQLRQTASKNTAVACLVNEGRSKMRLAWTVGKKNIFDRQGQIAAGTMKSKSTLIPDGLKQHIMPKPRD